MKTFALTIAALLAVACLASPAQAFHPYRQRVVVQRVVAHHHRAAVVVQPVVVQRVVHAQAFVQPVYSQAIVAPVVQQQVHGCQSFFSY